MTAPLTKSSILSKVMEDPFFNHLKMNETGWRGYVETAVKKAIDLALQSAPKRKEIKTFERTQIEFLNKQLSDKDSQIATLKDERDKEFKMRIDLESKLSKVREILDNYAPIELEEKIREALDG